MLLIESVNGLMKNIWSFSLGKLPWTSEFVADDFNFIALCRVELQITVARGGFVDLPIRESFEWWWSSKEPARLDKILNLKLAEPIEDFCFEASNINSLHFNFESRLGILYLAELQLDKLLWLDKF